MAGWLSSRLKAAEQLLQQVLPLVQTFLNPTVPLFRASEMGVWMLHRWGCRKIKIAHGIGNPLIKGFHELTAISNVVQVSQDQTSLRFGSVEMVMHLGFHAFLKPCAAQFRAPRTKVWMFHLWERHKLGIAHGIGNPLICESKDCLEVTAISSVVHKIDRHWGWFYGNEVHIGFHTFLNPTLRHLELLRQGFHNSSLRTRQNMSIAEKIGSPRAYCSGIQGFRWIDCNFGVKGASHKIDQHWGWFSWEWGWPRVWCLHLLF